VISRCHLQIRLKASSKFRTWKLPTASLTQTDVSRWRHSKRQDVSVFPRGFSHRQSVACPYQTVHPRSAFDAPNRVSALQQLPVLSGSAPSPSIRGSKNRTTVGVPPLLQCDQCRKTDAKATRRHGVDTQHAHRWVRLAGRCHVFLRKRRA
jgi:hypothetical protein